MISARARESCQAEFDIDSFPWESTDQKKGFMNLFQFLRKHGVDPRYKDVPGRLLAAYLIQRDLESNEWWLGLVSDHFDRLNERIVELNGKLVDLERRLAGHVHAGDNLRRGIGCGKKRSR